MEQIFKKWPSIAEMARDLGESYSTVSSWQKRGIPARRDNQIISAARRRGFHLTLAELAESRGQFFSATIPPAEDAA